jgi:hypothetical protein
MTDFIKYLKEADDRNITLKISHNTTIPSCALWLEYNIEQETREERMDWWSKFENHHNKFIQNTAIFWINLLENNVYYNMPE